MSFVNNDDDALGLSTHYGASVRVAYFTDRKIDEGESMVYVGKLNNTQLEWYKNQNKDGEIVQYEGDWYALNSLMYARQCGYRGVVEYVRFFKLDIWEKPEDHVKRCPICGEIPILKKSHHRNQLVCLNAESEKDHYIINKIGNHTSHSFSKALKIWNKRVIDYLTFGVGNTNWEAQKGLDEHGREFTFVGRHSADKFAAYSDEVCIVSDRDNSFEVDNVARLIKQAPKLRNACEEALNTLCMLKGVNGQEMRRRMHAIIKCKEALNGLLPDNMQERTATNA